MKLRITGQLQESSGKRAEESVLEAICDIFGNDYARIFINTGIPQQNKTPDFIIPAIDKDGVFTLMIVECKASPIIFPAGTTKYSDPFTQVSQYRERIISCLKEMNKKCVTKSYVVFPNMRDIPSRLVEGRGDVQWVTLQGFKECIKGYKTVQPNDPKYELVQMIYSRRDILQKYRQKITLSEEQDKILSWGFGGTKKIGGLAGTGKSLLLAKKMAKDIKNSQATEFIYLTHNKNLILKFQEYLQDFLELEGIKVTSTNRKAFPIILEGSVDGREIKLHLCNFDAFSTSYITQWLDACIFNEKNYGPLFKESIASRGNNPREDDFRRERENLICILNKHRSGKEKLFEKFDVLYIDEFQDCRIDPSRLMLPSLFVKKAKDKEPNICFTEDTLQSFVKYELLQDLNESYEHVHKKDLASYEQLGLPKGLHGRVVILNTIYRTPEMIFKASLNLLENQGGLLKKRKDEIKSLKYKNPLGDIICIDQEELRCSISTLLNKKQRFPHEVMIIDPIESQTISKIFNDISSGFHCNKVNTFNPPSLQEINFYHEYNVRGLEAKVVYLIIDLDNILKPNYIYTLMCRTQLELILVRSNTLPKEMFEDFIEMLSEKNLQKAS